MRSKNFIKTEFPLFLLLRPPINRFFNLSIEPQLLAIRIVSRKGHWVVDAFGGGSRVGSLRAHAAKNTDISWVRRRQNVLKGAGMHMCDCVLMCI